MSIPIRVIEHGSSGSKRNREWIVQLWSCDYEYLIYKVFRQKKSEVFLFNSDSGFGIKYSVLWISEDIVFE